ncbi:MAG: hypothetical protein HQ564_00395 [Candidatus Saganbacteria bacterium]|nr:hypothetical protein [Candidatus Saganbacteria bacterium]
MKIVQKGKNLSWKISYKRQFFNAPSVLPYSNLSSLNIFTRPDITSIFSNDPVLEDTLHYLNLGLARVSNRVGDISRASDAKRSELLARALPVAVADCCRTLYRKHNIRVSFHDMAIAGVNKYIAPMVELCGIENLVSLLVMLVNFKDNISAFKKLPKNFALEDFFRIIQIKLAGREAFYLTDQEMDSILFETIDQIKQIEQAKEKRGRDRIKLFDSLVGDSVRRDYCQSLAVLVQPEAMGRVSESLHETLEDKLDEVVGASLDSTQDSIMNEIAQLVSPEHGRYPDLSVEMTGFISLLDQAPQLPSKLLRVTYSGAVFKPDLSKIVGASDKDDEIFIPFSSFAAPLFEQLLVVRQADPQLYGKNISAAREAVAAAVMKGQKRIWRESKSVTTSRYLVEGLNLLLDAGKNPEKCFQNKIFWDTVQARYLEIEEMLELFGFVGRVPAGLFGENPMLCHVLFNELGMIIYDSESSKVEFAPYVEESRTIVFSRLKAKMRSGIKGKMGNSISPSHLSKLENILSKNGVLRSNDSNLSVLKRRIKEQFGMTVRNNILAQFTAKELEFLIQFFEFFPKHLLGPIRFIDKPTRLPASARQSTLKNMLKIYRKRKPFFFSFDKHPAAFMFDYWAQELINSGDSSLIYDNLLLMQINLARLIWSYFFSDTIKTEYAVIIGFENPETEGIQEQFSRSFVYYLQQKNKGVLLGQEDDEEGFFAKLLTPPRLLEEKL